MKLKKKGPKPLPFNLRRKMVSMRLRNRTIGYIKKRSNELNLSQTGYVEYLVDKAEGEIL